MSNAMKNVPKVTDYQTHNARAVKTITKTVTTPIITVNSKPMPNNEINTTTTNAIAIDGATLPTTTTMTMTTTTTTSAPPKKKSISSMSDEEIIQENLKELLEKKSREERKANGRLVAVIVAFLVIFLGIYQAWIRKTAALAGVLVPAFIMLSYGAWVVILAKRDKHNRDMFDRHIEEVALKNKTELEKARQKQAGKYDKATAAPPPSAASLATPGTGDDKQTSLHFENELADVALVHGNAGEQHKKQRRQRQRKRREHAMIQANDREVTVHRSALDRHPSIREKLFGQTMSHVKILDMQMRSNGGAAALATACVGAVGPDVQKSITGVTLEQKRKRLQRLDTLALPQVVRMRSAP